jgi:hypothetical protein
MVTELDAYRQIGTLRLSSPNASDPCNSDGEPCAMLSLQLLRRCMGCLARVGTRQEVLARPTIVV